MTLPLSALRAGPLGPRSLLGGIPASRRSLGRDLAREHTRADRARPLPQLGGNDRDRRPVRRAFDMAAEGVLERTEQQPSELDETAGNHDALGIENVREAGEP